MAQPTVARYERFPPPDDLRDLVEHIWMIEAPGRPVPVREILIPNGRPALVLSLAEPGIRIDPATEARQPNDRVLFGITTRPYVLEQRGPASYVGAQLVPWGLAGLIRDRLPADEFLPVESWLGAGATVRLADALATRPFGAERAARFGDFLAERLDPLPAPTSTMLHTAVAAVEESRGQLTVAELAARLGLTYRALYRLFTRHLGVPPKRFGEVVRYYHFVGALLGNGSAGRGDSAALLAGLHGYYDQAHAGRDFKRFTGVSPGTFRQIQHGIARLMHSEPTAPE